MHNLLKAVLLFITFLSFGSQVSGQVFIEGETEDQFRDRKNRGTVGLAAGQLGAAYPRLSQDLAKVLDDGDNLRVIPMLTYGSVGNVLDLLYLRKVDIAYTKSDNLAYFEKQLNVNLKDRLHYITRLYDAELHIVVRPEIKTLEDLRGKKVNIGLPGNAAHTTVPNVMAPIGIDFEILALDHAIGLEMMEKGEISGAMRVGGKPMRTFTTAAKDKGFHFLSISASQFAEHFADLYVLGKITHEDYPHLIPEGETVTTVAVPDILAVYNWPAGTDRYRRVENFIVSFFQKFQQLRDGPFHPKWKDVNLAATIPGWKRSAIAERMLAEITPQNNTSNLRSEFNTFLDENSANGSTSENNLDREKIFREFLTWRERTAQ